MLDEDQLAALRGAMLIAADDEVGEVQEVYAHSSDDLPAVVAVAVEGRRALVPIPLADAEVGDGRITVPFAREAVAGAPEAAGDVLAADEFEAVYAHYGISDADMREDTGLGGTGRADQGMSRDPRGGGGADDAAQGHP